MKWLFQIPLLFVVFAIFNIALMVSPSAFAPESLPFFSLKLPSQATWHATNGHFVALGSILLFFAEMLKINRFGAAGLTSQVISALLAIALLLEFLLWPPAGNSTCLIIALTCLASGAGGILLSAPNTKSDFSIGGIH